jgi:hypothetical protein
MENRDTADVNQPCLFIIFSRARARDARIYIGAERRLTVVRRLREPCARGKTENCIYLIKYAKKYV